MRKIEGTRVHVYRPANHFHNWLNVRGLIVKSGRHYSTVVSDGYNNTVYKVANKWIFDDDEED